ncbi:VWA domain-containing protein [Gemmatimonadota bacterium]
MRFNDPYLFHLLWLLPATALLFWMGARRRGSLLKKFVGLGLLPQLSQPMLPGGRALRGALLLGALLMLVVALARPQYGKEAVIMQREGRDIVFLLDTSLSMLADDIQPDRLSRARFEISSLLGRLQGDRVGLVPFAGDAFVLCPLTSDYSAFRLFLDGVDTDVISDPGTNLGRALEIGGSAFDTKEREYRVMILITDGEELEGDAISTAAMLKEQGVRLYTIGIGTPDGVPIPIKNAQGKVTDYKHNDRGEVVMTRLGEPLLVELAHAGGGEYYRAGQNAIELERIFEDINRLEKRQLESQEFTLYKDRYQWFLGIALLLMVLEVLVVESVRPGRGNESTLGEV